MNSTLYLSLSEPRYMNPFVQFDHPLFGSDQIAESRLILLINSSMGWPQDSLPKLLNHLQGDLRDLKNYSFVKITENCLWIWSRGAREICIEDLIMRSNVYRRLLDGSDGFRWHHQEQCFKMYIREVLVFRFIFADCIGVFLDSWDDFEDILDVMVWEIETIKDSRLK